MVRIDVEHCRPLGKNYNFFFFVNDVSDILQDIMQLGTDIALVKDGTQHGPNQSRVGTALL